MSAEDLKADSWSGNHPAAPERETNTRPNFPRAHLPDRRVVSDDASLAVQGVIARSRTLPVSGSRKRSLKDSCDWLSSG